MIQRFTNNGLPTPITVMDFYIWQIENEPSGNATSAYGGFILHLLAEDRFGISGADPITTRFQVTDRTHKYTIFCYYTDFYPLDLANWRFIIAPTCNFADSVCLSELVRYDSLDINNLRRLLHAE